jgi:hypothetical protein
VKHCPACQQTKPLDSFHKRSDRDGYRHVCIPCYRAQTRAHYGTTEAKAKAFARSAERRARKLQAMPRWLTEEQKRAIQVIYLYARGASEVFGQELHVDHIIPLAGKDVCGLHVPWNLQVMAGEANRAKSNKMEAA